MADDLEERVKAAYRRYFEGTRNWTDPWNRTLEEVAGPYDPEASEEHQQLRQRVVRILMKIRKDVEADLGDPYAMAVAAAVRDLRREKAAEEARAEWKAVDHERRERLRRERKLSTPQGPKEWTPRKDKKEEELERAVEKERESDYEPAQLYVMFDDKGALQGWKIDYPSYWPGHSGPVATVTVSDSTDYDEIQSAIEDALNELDWEEISKQLEEGDGA